MMHDLPKVLIVEDDREQLVELADLVTAFGYSCLAVDNGTEGVSLACANPDVGIVLLDLNLPDRHGLDVIAEIRNYIDPRRATQYLLITGEPDVDTAIEGFDRGALTFLVKPVDPGELKAHLAAAVLRIREVGRDTAQPASIGFRARLQKIMELTERLSKSEESLGPERLIGAINDVTRLRRALSDEPLSFKALNLLSELHRAYERSETLSVVTLCLAADMPQTTGLRYLQELIDAGLVEKQSDPHDGRRQFVTLSPAGMRKLAVAANEASAISVPRTIRSC